MPTKHSNIVFQNFNKIPSTITNLNENNPINNEQQEKTDSETNLPTTSHSRRLPLPTKLTFEQNITNLIEKESPLLQSELLTAEHELSVLRSRLAVNEGVTAITGTILESLKGQFESHHKVDRTTSPLDTYEMNLYQQISPIHVTSPHSLEIHYDAESPKSPYLLVKTTSNSFWIAQPIDACEVQKHLNKFSSPVMKRATIQLPDSFELDSDSDDEDIHKEKPRSNNSISEEDENLVIDRYEQLLEMKTIRSSSLLQREDQFDNFDSKIDEIYSIIDYLKHEQLTSLIINNLHKKIHDLKFIMHNIHLNKQDELRIEYELDELENLFDKTSQHEDYNLMELFEQNLNELQHLIEQIKTIDGRSQRDLVSEFEDKLEAIQNIDDEIDWNDQKASPKQTHIRLIPENPVVTSDVFFEGDKIPKRKKSLPTNPVRLIPEEARISASNFYEGDLTRSLYHHSEQGKETENISSKKILIPEKPRVSGEVFYEGDSKRSMFSKRSLSNQTEPISSSSSLPIDNLREIMSDLMLAASWSRRPSRLEKQQTKDEVEILAESFITTERRHPRLSLCEITHEIENLPLSNPEEQITKSVHATIEEEDELITEQSPEQEDKLPDMIIIDKKPLNEDISRRVSTDVTFIFVSPPSFEQEDDQSEQQLSTESKSDNDEPGEIIEHISEDDSQNSYENQLLQTSNDVVEQILNQACSQTIEQEQDQIYYQAALRIVNDAIANALSKYNSEQSLSQSVSTSSDSEDEEENSNSYLSSDDEENENLIPQISDQPYVFFTDVVTSKSTQELGDLVQELQTLEHQIHDIHSVSSSSSLSENDQMQSSDLSIPQIITTKSVNELTNLVFELQNIEEQLEDKLDSTMEIIKSPISSKSFNELGGLINELNTVSKQLNNRIHEEIFISTNIDSLSEDIVKYRRDSQSNLNENYYHSKEERPITCTSMNDGDRIENQAIQDMVDNIIKQAQDVMLKESPLHVKSVPSIVVKQRCVPCQRSSLMSISDDLDVLHEDNIVDKKMELAAQVDYLRRMSRYENLSDQHEQIEESCWKNDQTSDIFIHPYRNDDDDDDELKSPSYLTIVDEEHSSFDEGNLENPSPQPQMEISQDSITQPSSDSLDYHSAEIDTNQLQNRRTASENSLHSTTSSIHPYDTHSLSTSCLIDKDDSISSNNDNEKNMSIIITSSIGFFDRVKSFVTKPVEIVQEAMENLNKQRINDTDKNPTNQHFQSAYDLHDEEKSKLVRSPELYNMDNVIKHHHKSLLTSSQIQYRTLSESSLVIDDPKRHSLTTASNETSVEFLTAISKENSFELIQQQRLSTPFDDVPEKESSPEQSESSNLPTSTFSDAFEPTSSCQRPLAFRITGQQELITEEQFNTAANGLVNQILNDVVSELSGEQEDSSISNASNKLSPSSSTSSDDDKLAEEDEEEYLQNQFKQSMTTEVSNPPEVKPSSRTSFSKTLRRAQTDIRDFDIEESPITLILPIIRRNSQSDTEVYFHTLSSSINDYRQMENFDDNSSSDEKSSNPKQHTLSVKQYEKYSGEGEESSGGKEQTIPRRKRSNDLTNTHEISSTKNISLKFELNDNSKRRESLDSPPQDSTEKSIFKSLQERILRTNLESFQIDLKYIHREDENLQEKTYSSITKKSSSSYDYDGGSETDRDDFKILPVHNEIILQPTSKQTDYITSQKFSCKQSIPLSIELNQMSSLIDLDTKSLLEELIESINDDLALSISSEPLSSQSDATTVLFNSINDPNDKYYLSIETSSSSSSSHSVIYHQQKSQIKTNLTSKSKKQSSTPSISNAELIGHYTKKKFRSYPGSLGGSHISSSPITSIPTDYYSMTTTSTTFQSGKQHVDE